MTIIWQRLNKSMFFSFILLSQAYHVAIDFGSFYTKASTFVAGEPPQCAHNYQTKRLTPTFLSFRFPSDYNVSSNISLTPKEAKNLEPEFGEKAYQYMSNKPWTGTGYFPIFAGINISNHNSRLFVNSTCARINHFDLTSLFLKLFIDCISSGRAIKDVVIVVPASMSNSQKHYLEDAVSVSSFSVIGTIEDVDSIIHVYCIERSEVFSKSPKKVLFLDIGATSTKAYLVGFEIVNNSCTATRFPYYINNDIGGSYITVSLVEYLKKKYRIRSNNDVMNMKLFQIAEKMKKELTLHSDTSILMDDIEGNQLSLSISVKEFDSILYPYAKQLITIITSAIGPLKADILEIIGGSSRIPLLEKILRNEFPGIHIKHSLNADEVLSIGGGYYSQFKNDISNHNPIRIISNYSQYSISMKTQGTPLSICKKHYPCINNVTFPSPAQLFLFSHEANEMNNPLSDSEFGYVVEYPENYTITLFFSSSPFSIYRTQSCNDTQCQPGRIRRYLPAVRSPSRVFKALINGEKFRNRLSKAHNELEQLSIFLKNQLETNETLKMFIQADHSVEIQALVESTQKWLFINSSSITKIAEFQTRINSLKSIINKINQRVTRNSEQNTIINLFIQTVQLSKKAIVEWESKKSPDEINKFRDLVSQSEALLYSTLSTLNTIPLWDDNRVLPMTFEESGRNLYSEYLKMESIPIEKSDNVNEL